MTPRRRGRSIQIALPLVIGALWVAAVVLLGSMAYAYVRRTARDAAAERLASVSEQLGGLLQAQAGGMAGAARKVAAEPALRRYLESTGAGEDAMPQAPLEEHLFLIWPEDATGGVSPAWKEVSGTSVRMPFQIGHLSPSGRVKTPDGCYWLTTVSSSLAQAAAVLSAETPTDLPRRPALTSVSSGLCVTTDPTVRSLEVFVDGSEYTPERYTNASAWNVVAQCELNVERPVRLIDGTGQVPRAFDDPLLPPGRWVFRLDMRDSHFRTPLGDGTTIGEDPMHVHDHRLRVWPAGAHARDSEMEEDEHVWLGRRR